MSELVHPSFDYTVLSPEQAQRTQEAEYRMIGRAQKTIIENGRDLLAVKQDIGHGHFLNWIRSLGISEKTAENWMNVADKFGDIRNGYEFENRALYLLSTSKVPELARQEAKERAEAGEKITEELARQIRDAHQAKEQAVQQLSLLQEQAQSQKEQLTQKITELQQQITMRAHSAIEIREVPVTPPDVIAHLETLQAQVEKLTEQRDNLSKKAQQLSLDLEALRETREAEREQEARALRIRQRWQKATEAFHQNVLKLLGQLPTPLDTQDFESEDWAQLAQVKEAAQRVVAECERLAVAPRLMIIDADK